MIFDQQMFLISSIMLDVLLYDQNIFLLFVNYLRKCALTDPQSNYLPLKYPKPYILKYIVIVDF